MSSSTYDHPSNTLHLLPLPIPTSPCQRSCFLRQRLLASSVAPFFPRPHAGGLGQRLCSVQALVVVEAEVEAPPLPTPPGIALAAVEGKGTRFPLCARASSPSHPSLHKGIKFEGNFFPLFLPPDKFYLQYYTAGRGKNSYCLLR